jgi:hypothetical protein
MAATSLVPPRPAARGFALRGLSGSIVFTLCQDIRGPSGDLLNGPRAGEWPCVLRSCPRERAPLGEDRGGVTGSSPLWGRDNYAAQRISARLY